MTKKHKRWREMTAGESAAATRDMRRFQIALALEKKPVEQTGKYAVKHGVAFSEVVADALRQLMRKKTA